MRARQIYLYFYEFSQIWPRENISYPLGQHFFYFSREEGLDNLPKIFSTFSNLSFLICPENFLLNLQNIFINYVEIELNCINNKSKNFKFVSEYY